MAVLLADVAQAWTLGLETPAARVLADALWPGGLTLVLTVQPDARLPRVLAAGTPTIGVRVPDHHAPRALAAVLGPLPTTSANLSGRPDARDAAEVGAALGEAIALVIDGGPIRGGPASTVVDCTTDRPTILRSGAIDPRRIAAILDEAGIPHAHRARTRPFSRDPRASRAGPLDRHEELCVQRSSPRPRTRRRTDVAKTCPS